MPRTLRCHHRNIYICRRNNLRKMQTEAMCGHQHFASSKSWLDVMLKNGVMILIGNEDHDHVGLFSSVGRSQYAQSLSFSLFTALTALRKPNDDITTIVTHIERVRVSLTPIADDGNALLLHEF